MGAVNLNTGEVRVFNSTDLASSPSVGPDEVLVYGTEEDIHRVATDVQRRIDFEAKRAKRKAQKRARRRNR